MLVGENRVPLGSHSRSLLMTPSHAQTWLIDHCREFVTNVIVASGQISGSTQRSAFWRFQSGDDDHVDLHELPHQGRRLFRCLLEVWDIVQRGGGPRFSPRG